MKKIIATVVLIATIVSSGFSQIEYFGKNDVWSLNADGIEVYDKTVDIYFNLDMNRTRWSGFDPYEEGLIAIGMMIELNTETGTGKIIFAYNSEYELSLGNWMLVYNEANNAFLMGGQVTNGDTVHFERISNGTYVIATEVYLDEDWSKWFYNNAGGYYKIAIMEYNYGDNLIFKIPEELFMKINEIYNSVNGNTYNDDI